MGVRPGQRQRARARLHQLARAADRAGKGAVAGLGEFEHAIVGHVAGERRRRGDQTPGLDAGAALMGVAAGQRQRAGAGLDQLARAADRARERAVARLRQFEHRIVDDIADNGPGGRDETPVRDRRAALIAVGPGQGQRACARLGKAAGTAQIAGKGRVQPVGVDRATGPVDRDRRRHRAGGIDEQGAAIHHRLHAAADLRHREVRLAVVDRARPGGGTDRGDRHPVRTQKAEAVVEEQHRIDARIAVVERPEAQLIGSRDIDGEGGEPPGRRPIGADDHRVRLAADVAGEHIDALDAGADKREEHAVVERIIILRGIGPAKAVGAGGKSERPGHQPEIGRGGKARRAGGGDAARAQAEQRFGTRTVDCRVVGQDARHEVPARANLEVGAAQAQLVGADQRHAAPGRPAGQAVVLEPDRHERRRGRCGMGGARSCGKTAQDGGEQELGTKASHMLLRLQGSMPGQPGPPVIEGAGVVQVDPQ